MWDLFQAWVRGKGGGAALPCPWPSLTHDKASFRTGELVLIAGLPGAGKSALALVTALRMNVPTIYFSSDSGAHTQMMRLLAYATGTDQAQIETWMETAPPDEVQAAVARHGGSIRWVFDANCLDDIELELDAYEEVWGQAPQLVICDNLIDFAAGGDDEFRAQRDAVLDMRVMASDRECCFLVLHHIQESPRPVPDGQAPAAESIFGRDTRVPSLVLTMRKQDDGYIAVGIVKNRHGNARRDGKLVKWFSFEPRFMQLREAVFVDSQIV